MLSKGSNLLLFPDRHLSTAILYIYRKTWGVENLQNTQIEVYEDGNWKKGINKNK